MKRWSGTKQDDIDNARVDAFLQEIAEVSKRHGLSLGHEDPHGSFKVHVYSDDNISWLMAADDWTDSDA